MNACRKNTRYGIVSTKRAWRRTERSRGRRGDSHARRASFSSDDNLLKASHKSSTLEARSVSRSVKRYSHPCVNTRDRAALGRSERILGSAGAGAGAAREHGRRTVPPADTVSSRSAPKITSARRHEHVSSILRLFSRRKVWLRASLSGDACRRATVNALSAGQPNVEERASTALTGVRRGWRTPERRSVSVRRTVSTRANWKRFGRGEGRSTVAVLESFRRYRRHQLFRDTMDHQLRRHLLASDAMAFAARRSPFIV